MNVTISRSSVQNLQQLVSEPCSAMAVSSLYGCPMEDFVATFSPLTMEENMLLLVVHNCAQDIGQKVMHCEWWTKMSMADELPGLEIVMNKVVQLEKQFVEVRVTNTNTAVEIVGPRKNDDEKLQYDPNDLENYFSFMVHHGGEFDCKDDKTKNYIGGTISFFDYVSMNELSLLDMDDIVVQLEYKLPVGYWIEVSGFGKPFNIGIDQDLIWFKDKIPHNRDHCYEVSDDEEQPASGVNIGPAGVAIGLGDCGVKVGSSGVNIGSVGVDIGWVGGGGAEIGLGSGGVDIGLLVLTMSMNQKNVDLDLDLILISDQMILRSLDRCDGEKDEGRPPRKFIKTKYHEFNISRDMQDPVFRVGMEFASVDLFRNAIKAHAVKHMRVVHFKKNVPNIVREVCIGESSFNKAILQAHDKSLVTLIEMIMNYSMKRLARNRVEVEKWYHDIWPKLFKFVERLKLESSKC
ncbi:hypothetical protein Ddye_020717 [Dipteronia dyeriana]|uniref:PB1-like domain-containing protein n=1 Tax=Dipteronia dyeriana TaxID=168575 RepID=A0AAD9U0V1_9ROSI|nr:hypothetical protein Ddye_020717 [Dipteronia dyeriana]